MADSVFADLRFEFIELPSDAVPGTPRMVHIFPKWKHIICFDSFITEVIRRGWDKAGAVKISPPSRYPASTRQWDVEELSKFISIKDPVQQVITKEKGGVFYQESNIMPVMTLIEFQTFCGLNQFSTPDDDSVDNLEREYFDDLASRNRVNPMYGADIGVSLFDEFHETDPSYKYLNVNRLGSFLDRGADGYGIDIDGITASYLYFGMWRSTFAIHSEDKDFCSINFLHFGMPKTWYVIPSSSASLLEEKLSCKLKAEAKKFPCFMRHKLYIVPPQLLKEFGVPFNRVTQEKGQFVVTFPRGYHQGFNHGFNCAEASNFTHVSCLPFVLLASVCEKKSCPPMPIIASAPFAKLWLKPDNFRNWFSTEGLTIQIPDGSGQSVKVTAKEMDKVWLKKFNQGYFLMGCNWFGKLLHRYLTPADWLNARKVWVDLEDPTPDCASPHKRSVPPPDPSILNEIVAEVRSRKELPVAAQVLEEIRPDEVNVEMNFEPDIPMVDDDAEGAPVVHRVCGRAVHRGGGNPDIWTLKIDNVLKNRQPRSLSEIRGDINRIYSYRLPRGDWKEAMRKFLSNHYVCKNGKYDGEKK